MLNKSICIYVFGAFVFIGFFYSGIYAQEGAWLCGTWANRKYTQGTQKLIISPDGSYVVFTNANAAKADQQGKCKIVDRWSDSEGNRWYKTIFLAEDGETSFCLMKVSDSGRTIECVHDSENFPKFINAEIYTYRKFYRE